MWEPVPTAVGVYVTADVHVALLLDPLSVHVPLKVPVPLVAKDTVPVGVLGVTDVSTTIAIQLVALLETTAAG